MIVALDLATSLISCLGLSPITVIKLFSGIFALMGMLAEKETCVEAVTSSDLPVLNLWNWIEDSGYGSTIYPYTIVLHVCPYSTLSTVSFRLLLYWVLVGGHTTTCTTLPC